MKKYLTCLLICFCFLLNSNAQFTSKLYKQSIDSAKIFSEIKDKLLYEIYNSHKYDSIFFADTFVTSDFKKKSISKSNVHLTLIDFEQDFDNDTSILYEYHFLISDYSTISCHGCKIVSSRQWLMAVTSKESFSNKECTDYLNKIKSQEYFNIYKDEVPWRKFKSYKRTINIGKIVAMPTTDLFKPFYKDNN